MESRSSEDRESLNGFGQVDEAGQLRTSQKSMKKGTRPTLPTFLSSFLLVELSTLEELDVGSVAKVPRVHGAVAPGEPLVAAFYLLLINFLPLRLVGLEDSTAPYNFLNFQ